MMHVPGSAVHSEGAAASGDGCNGECRWSVGTAAAVVGGGGVDVGANTVSWQSSRLLVAVEAGASIAVAWGGD